VLRERATFRGDDFSVESEILPADGLPLIGVDIRDGAVAGVAA
jgi:hypothetical protein